MDSKILLTLVAIFAILCSLGCTSTNSSDSSTLVVYSGRSEELVGPIIEQFSQSTGITVKLKWGSSSGLAATLLEENRNSRADVFLAQDPGALNAVSHLLTPIAPDLLERVSPAFRSAEGKWIGLSGRVRTTVYNTKRVNKSNLPDSIWGFTDPVWRGRIGWAPTNASFQVMVTAMRHLWGETKTRQWIEGIKANDPQIYAKNTPIVAAVGIGEVDVGFVNHYYVQRFIAERGEGFPAKNFYSRVEDPGSLVIVSGAGIHANARNKEEAIKFLEFMLSKESQDYFVTKTFEYPVIANITTIGTSMVPLTDIQNPNVDFKHLSDLKGTLTLLRDTGILP